MAKIINTNDETTPEKTPPKKAPKKKMLPNVIDHCTKAGKIELQNLLFGTSEKKLLVSNEFLNSMTIKYVSRRMKSINTCFESISNTKIPSRFFHYSDEIENCLEELIKLEPYYIFKNPIPSVYKKNFIEKKPELISKMITKAWKFALQKHPLADDIENIDPKVLAGYDAIINEMLSFKDRMSEDDLSLINSYYIQVHGEEEIIEEELDLSDDEILNEADETDTEPKDIMPDNNDSE